MEAEAPCLLAGSTAHNSQPQSQKEMAREMLSRAQDEIAAVAALVELNSENTHFCNLVESSAQQFIKDIESALEQSSEEKNSQHQPNTAEIGSPCGTSNSMKRKKPFIEEIGKRSGMRAGRENYHTSHQPLKSSKSAEAPAKLNLVQQCARLKNSQNNA